MSNDLAWMSWRAYMCEFDSALMTDHSGRLPPHAERAICSVVAPPAPRFTAIAGVAHSVLGSVQPQSIVANEREAGCCRASLELELHAVRALAFARLFGKPLEDGYGLAELVRDPVGRDAAGPQVEAVEGAQVRSICPERVHQRIGIKVLPEAVCAEVQMLQRRVFSEELAD
mmetsp:Transcript_23547/g.53577  ORF Transcript_23547/g.53577 Transcript_23547/m.53577 type:complete len:172 (+) Transcript_23547:141-656(+)